MTRGRGFSVRPQGFLRGLTVVHTFHGLPDDLAIDGAPSPPQRPAWLPATAPRSARRRPRAGRGAAQPARYGRRALPGDRRVHHPARRARQPDPSHPLRHRRATLGARATPRAGGSWARPRCWSYRKGIDVLLEACARLELPYQLEIYGDGPLRAALESQAARLGVRARFHGFVEDMRDHLLAMDLFVLPTRGDNLPVAILEAMAYALPVVSTRVGGVPEQIDDGVTGLLVEPDRPADSRRRSRS